MPTWPVNLKPGSPEKTDTCSMIKILFVIFIFCFESIYSANFFKDKWTLPSHTSTDKKFDQKAIEKLTCDILKNPLPLSETIGDLNLDNFKFSNLFCFNVKRTANESKTKITTSTLGDSINNFMCSNISLNQFCKLLKFPNLKLSQANINSFLLKSRHLLARIDNVNLKDGTNSFNNVSFPPVMNSPMPTTREEATNLNTLLVENLTNDNSSTNIESLIKYFAEISNCNYLLNYLKDQRLDLSSVRVVLLRPLSSNNLNSSSCVNRNNYSSFKLIFEFSSDSKLTIMIYYEEIGQIKDTNMVNPRAADSNISIENLQVFKGAPMKSVRKLIASESKSRGYYNIISNSSLRNGTEYYMAKTFILFPVNLNCSQVDFTAQGSPISRKAIQPVDIHVRSLRDIIPALLRSSLPDGGKEEQKENNENNQVKVLDVGTTLADSKEKEEEGEAAKLSLTDMNTFPKISNKDVSEMEEVKEKEKEEEEAAKLSLADINISPKEEEKEEEKEEKAKEEEEVEEGEEKEEKEISSESKNKDNGKTFGQNGTIYEFDEISEEEGEDSEFLNGGSSNQMAEPVDPEGIESKIDDNSNLTTQNNLTTTKTTIDNTNPPTTTTTNTNINKTQENLAKAVDPNLSKKAAENLLEKANLKNTGAKPLSEIALSAEKGENGYFWPLLISFFVVGIIVLVATFGYFKYVQAKEDQAVEL
jgi:hypothetical protein